LARKFARERKRKRRAIQREEKKRMRAR